MWGEKWLTASRSKESRVFVLHTATWHKNRNCFPDSRTMNRAIFLSGGRRVTMKCWAGNFKVPLSGTFAESITDSRKFLPGCFFCCWGWVRRNLSPPHVKMARGRQRGGRVQPTDTDNTDFYWKAKYSSVNFLLPASGVGREPPRIVSSRPSRFAGELICHSEVDHSPERHTDFR